MAKSKNLLPMIIEKDNRLWTTSLEVADKFGKRHFDVMKSVENLDAPEDFQQRNFSLLGRKIPGGEQKYYIISGDEFIG